MKKYITIIIVAVFMSICFMTFFPSYALNENKENMDSFFKVSSDTVALGDNIEMILNLNNIDYDAFKLEIISNYEVKNIETDSGIEILNEENEISMTIEKMKLNISEIQFKYSLPENINIGDCIELEAIISDLDSEEYKNVLVSVLVVEKDDFPINVPKNPENSNGLGDFNGLETVESKSQIQEENLSKTVNNVSSNMNYMSFINTSYSSKDVQTVTYQGDCNNYLKSLSVEDCDFTKDFSKENLTYFVNIENADSLNIIAVPESESSLVKVYGNENIKSGSKILISVTAENGSARMYRIFVI